MRIMGNEAEYIVLEPPASGARPRWLEPRPLNGDVAGLDDDTVRHAFETARARMPEAVWGWQAMAKSYVLAYVPPSAK